MSEFNTSGSLFLELDESSASSARSQLEETLASDPITIQTEVQPGGGAGGGSAGSLTSGLDEQTAELDSISASWEDSLQLDENRNELLRELVDMAEAGQLGGSGGGRGLIGGLGNLLIGGGLSLGLLGGSLIGGKLMEFLRGFSFPKLKIPSIPPLKIPNIPPLGLPDSIPSLNLPDVIPPLKIPDIPDIGLPGSIPNLGIPGSIPDLGVPAIPDLGVPDDVPNLGVPDTIPDLGLPEIPTLGVPTDIPVIDIAPPPFPVPIPIGDGSSSSSGSSTSSPSLLDQITGAVAVQGAATLNFLEDGADAVTGNAGKIATGVGAGALVKQLASRIPSSGGALALTRGQITRGEDRARDFGEWFWSQLGVDVPDGDSSSSGSSRDSTSRENEARKSKRDGPIIGEYSPTYEVTDFAELERRQRSEREELKRRIDDIENSITEVR